MIDPDVKKLNRLKDGILNKTLPYICYAQTGGDFWYKVLFITEKGVFKCDTGISGILLSKRKANWIIKTQGLIQVTPEEVKKNWGSHGLLDYRTFEKKFIQNT